MTLLRHIVACNNARLPGARLPFRVGTTQVGWSLPDFAAALSAHPGLTRAPDHVALEPGADFDAICRDLAAQGWFRWRDEAFDMRAVPDGPVLGQIDRGALPSFGVAAEGVHLNGLMRRPDGPHLWVARRAADKLLDPGKLDHIVAGGIGAGFTPAETLEKEAAEEAALPAALLRGAVHTGTVAYAMIRDEGLRRDRLHCYDVDLPEDFTPVAADGEVAAFELWPLPEVLDRVRRTDDFKFNVNLVLIALFLRLGLIAEPEAGALRAALAHGSGAM